MIRVLLADDSPVTRAVLKDILGSTIDIHVVGEAENGEEAVAKASCLSPDLIIMDINMPVMNGLDAISEIMAVSPVPILVLSASTEQRNVDLAFSAIKLGALDVMRKPSAVGDDLRTAEAEIVERVRLLSKIRVIRHHRRRHREPEPAVWKSEEGGGERTLLAIGASTGGPKAVHSIVRALPREFPGTVFIVQHIASGFAAGFAQWLERDCSIRVRLATEGLRITPGEAIVAPDNLHMMVEGGKIRLLDDLPVNCCRPSIDVLFRSLALESGSKTVGVLLTGMGRDGAQGLRAIREQGGATIVQDEQTSAVFGMPKAAIALKAAERVLPLGEIPAAVLEVFSKGGGIS